MFSLLIALYTVPVTGQVVWEVYQEGFTSYEDCLSYAEDHRRELYDYGSGVFVCDQLKQVK